MKRLAENWGKGYYLVKLTTRPQARKSGRDWK